ncbi:hypothetical protein HBE96_04775 [Clostridium sp. P21]|uniref:Lipoprotein n=1 Tax=Clostridium muellerianum TaxID=2716538 RepID=A0A7Y0EEF6_9CLOT|nr:hypothetical protein [Clostridium muellerianum]NMM62014.1 hypothetical protein [Clostridium muellerianum]
MKKHNLFSKSIMGLIAISMSLSLLAGCQSKSTTSNSSSTTKQITTQASQSSSKKVSSDERKKQIQEGVKALVTAGTITQAQSDKIVEALTTMPSGNKDGENKQDSNKPDNKPNQQGGQQDNNQNSNQNKPGSPLSKLVSEGVITQTQADAVMEKIKGSMLQKDNGQTSQNNNTQTSQSSEKSSS